MARPKEVIDAELAKKAREELKNILDHKISMRLQAISSCAEHPISLVASIFGASRQTLWRWIKRFKERGADGLRDLPKGHNPAKLNEKQRERVAKWLRETKDSRGEAVHWTLAKLANAIHSEFGICVGITPLWRLVRNLGFRQKVPRPAHAKADSEMQAVFKKNR